MLVNLRYFKFKPSHFKIGFISFIISFFSYSIINVLPLGIKITTAGAYIWGSLIVWFGSYFTNHLEYKRYQQMLDKRKIDIKKDGESKDVKKD